MRAGSVRRALVRGTAIATIALFASAVCLAAEPVPLQIGAQPLGAALREFARESGVQILFADADVAGMTSPGLSGRFTRAEALRQLLAGTRLSYAEAGPNTFIVRSPLRRTSAPGMDGTRGQPIPPDLALAEGAQQYAMVQQPDAIGSTPLPEQTGSAVEADEIVVTGQRASLEAAAALKRNADQVVDSIVAEDIGKFPDNSTAAALQRVPGVQVFRGDNNEIVGPIVRGLPDILTTINGREIFSGVGRGFAFQDLPAEALAGVDVFKSNTANLIEGGVAGVIDMKLRKPFDFRDFTIAANARAIYSKNTDKVDPIVGLLVSDRFDTGIGEMGLLANVSYQRTRFNRPISFNCDPRSASQGPPGAAGTILPTCAGGLNQTGVYERPQVNAAFQWQATPDLEFYLDGLYAGYRSPWETDFIFSDIFAARDITDVSRTDNCIRSRVNPAGFLGDPNDPFQDLCYGAAATFNNVPGLTSTQARKFKTDQYVFGGGFRFERDRLALRGDLSRVRSTNENRTIIVDIGKQIPRTTVVVDDNQHGTIDMPGNPLGDPADFRLANGLFQDINRSKGTLWAGTLDASYEVGGLLAELQSGFRYARRVADFAAVIANPAAPGGNRVTTIAAAGLPDDFLVRSPDTVPYINGGANWMTPDRDYILANTDRLRQLYGASAGDPAFDPSRSFFAREETTSGYVQARYEAQLGGDMQLDGLVGVRLTRTDRTLRGTGRVSGVLTPVATDTSDTDWLPNANARLRITPDLQLRFSYAKTLARPAFTDLNPGLFYDVPLNANIRPAGSGGNPDLRPQKSDAFDATLEYYLGRSSYVSVAGYYRKIKDRTISGQEPEVIDGITYLITRPRNTAGAKLKGVEVAGQAFFDFLPGALGGFGALANYTLADSEITSETDVLRGFPLLGVSKHSYNLGLLYEKYGITGRLIYNYRSGYNEFLLGGQFLQEGRAAAFNKVRGFGRLDFSLGYDVTPNVTVTVDGTNINRSKYLSYFDVPYFPHDIRVDETTYSIGVRARF